MAGHERQVRPVSRPADEQGARIPVALADRPKPPAAEAIAELKQLGLTPQVDPSGFYPSHGRQARCRPARRIPATQPPGGSPPSPSEAAWIRRGFSRGSSRPFKSPAAARSRSSPASPWARLARQRLAIAELPQLVAPPAPSPPSPGSATISPAIRSTGSATPVTPIPGAETGPASPSGRSTSAATGPGLAAAAAALLWGPAPIGRTVADSIAAG